MNSTGTIRSLDRGLTILRLIQAHGRMSLAEIHAKSGLPKATLLRILSTLAQHGFIRKGISDGLYSFGLGMPDTDEYGSHLATKGGSTLKRLIREFGWPSDLSAFDGEGMKVIESTRSISPYALKRDVVGLRVSVILSAMGRAYLAACSHDKRLSILKQTMSVSHQHSLNARHPEMLEELFKDIREKGYAAREPFVAADGLMAIAVPVHSGDEPIGSLNLVFVASAMKAEEAAGRYLKRLQDAAAEIGSELTSLPV